jgi:hypothetical protein
MACAQLVLTSPLTGPTQELAARTTDLTAPLARSVDIEDEEVPKDATARCLLCGRPMPRGPCDPVECFNCDGWFCSLVCRRRHTCRDRLGKSVFAEQQRLQNFVKVLGFHEVWEYIWEDIHQVRVYIAATWLYFPRINIIGELKAAYVQVTNVNDAILDEEIESYELQHGFRESGMFSQQCDFWERFDYSSDSS